MGDRHLSANSIALLHYLMQNEQIANKVKAAGKKGKSYSIYTINDDGTVILGETKYRWWNQFINCQYELTFETLATCIWDSLADLSAGGNKEAIIHGLGKDVLIKAQREKDYNWVVERLTDCFRHVCNKKNEDESPLEGGSGKSDRKIVYKSAEQREREQTPVVLNINTCSNRRTYRFPDATGRTSLVFEFGVVDVRCENN